MKSKSIRIFGILTALCLPVIANAQTVLSNDWDQVISLSGTTVDMYGRSELHITGSGTPISGCVIDLHDIDSWVFLHNVVPSAAASLLGQFRVSGASAVNNTNVKVVQYGQGAVVIPYPSNFQPMQVFDGENFSGDSQLLSPNTSYAAVLGGNVSSFTLKRGYTATLAQYSGGTGKSINYVAADGDLQVGALPDDLNNQVRFIRVYPWHWVSKKGSCDIAPADLKAKWYYNWNVTWQAANPDYEYVAIKQQRWWPGLPSPSDAGYLGVNHVSGFNEPNNPVEDAYTSLNNGDVATAVGAWGELEGTGLRIGAPAVTDGGMAWIRSFMDQAEAAGRRVDYVPIHYYRASNNDPSSAANNLYWYLKDIYDYTHKPIWLTEFNNGANWTGGTDPTFQQNSDCIQAMINMMDDAPWVERYSVYSAVEEVRQVYYNAGGYTPMGAMYRDHVSPIAYQQIIPGEGMNPSAEYYFENNLDDSSGSGNHAVSKDYPDFVAGHSGGTAIQFDGVDDHVILPDSVSDSTDFTFAAWVNWTGSGLAWQRIFDFGIMDSGNFMFLTPNASGAGLRFAINQNWNGEQQLNTGALSPNTWTHVAVTLSGNTGRLYVNGSQVAVNTTMTYNPVDLGAIQHYLGRSMFPNDPYFSGKLDDVIIKNQALSPTQIAALAAGNQPPSVSTNFIDDGTLTQGEVYTGTVAGTATDPEAGAITYTKVYGPAWLSIASDGSFSGTPGYDIHSDQLFTIRATDPNGTAGYFVLKIGAPPYDFGSGPVALWTFDDAGAANGAFMPGNGSRADLDGDGAMDSDDFRISSIDRSGNGNHLTAWTPSWMKWNSDSSAGDFSMQNGNNYPAAGTDSSYNPGISGIDAEAITPAQWTVETIFKCYGANANNDNQTIVGRDGYLVGGSSSVAAALYLSIRGTEMAIEYTDVSGVSHVAQTSGLGLQYNQWYRVAAVSDGTTLSLRINGTVRASTVMTGSSADTSLGLGYGTWTVARGMWNGPAWDQGHVDRFNGVVDAVAISGLALAPGSFVLEVPAIPTGLTAITGDSTVTLSWNPVGNALSYAVKSAPTSNGTYGSVGSPTSTNLVLSGLANGVRSYYVVSALGGGGKSANSAPISAVPSAAIVPGEYVIDDYVLQGGTNFVLTVTNSVAGHDYRVLATDSLTPPAWTNVLTNGGSGSDLQFNIPIDPTKTSRFFMLDVQRQ